MHRVRGDGVLLPPRWLSFVGRSDFRQTGDEFLGHSKELGGLEPGHRMLDAGCGIGRMANQLADYPVGGSCEGFDVGRKMLVTIRLTL